MLKPDKYSEFHLAAAYEYAEKIRSGEIRSNTWIKLAVERFIKTSERGSRPGSPGG